MFSKLLSFVVLFVAATSLYAQPVLEFVGGDTQDWGKVSGKDKSLTAKMVMKNAGDQLLIINKVKPACGCTTTKFEKTSLKPGETTSVDVTLNVAHYSRDVHKTITVSSNDGKNPRKIFHLKAFVEKPVMVEPRENVFFHKAVVGSAETKSVKIKNSTDKPVIIKRISTSDDKMLKVNLENETKIPPKGFVELKIECTPLKAGNLRGSVTLKTDHPDATRLNIRVWGRASNPE